MVSYFSVAEPLANISLKIIANRSLVLAFATETLGEVYHKFTYMTERMTSLIRVVWDLQRGTERKGKGRAIRTARLSLVARYEQSELWHFLYDQIV